MSQYLCNLILPGAAKSGTSSLHEILDRHPNICMSNNKEPQFFSFDDLYGKGPDFHNKLFEGNQACRFFGESSQSYFVDQCAMKRIYQCLETPKVILLLRHPIERLWSHYRWNRRLGVETESLLEAINNRGDDTGYDFDSRVGMYRERGGYLSFSRYSRYVNLWKDVFGDGNVLIVRTEDMRVKQECAASRCFSFLELSDFRISNVTPRNTTEATRRIAPRSLRNLGKMMPKKMKNEFYFRTRNWLLKTPVAAKQMTSDELWLCQELLAEDIEFYESLVAQ